MSSEVGYRLKEFLALFSPESIVVPNFQSVFVSSPLWINAILFVSLIYYALRLTTELLFSCKFQHSIHSALKMLPHYLYSDWSMPCSLSSYGKDGLCKSVFVNILLLIYEPRCGKTTKAFSSCLSIKCQNDHWWVDETDPLKPRDSKSQPVERGCSLRTDPSVMSVVMLVGVSKPQVTQRLGWQRAVWPVIEQSRLSSARKSGSWTSRGGYCAVARGHRGRKIGPWAQRRYHIGWLLRKRGMRD